MQNFLYNKLVLYNIWRQGCVRHYTCIRKLANLPIMPAACCSNIGGGKICNQHGFCW